VLAVASVVAVGAFGSSLDRLRSTPARYGFTADAQVSDVQETTIRSLLRDPAVTAIADVQNDTVEVAGLDARGSGYRVRKGTFGYTVLGGRLPTSPDEVALGPDVLDRTHVSIGDRVSVRSKEGATARPLVVGRVLGQGEGPNDYDRVAIFTADGFERLRAGTFREAYVSFRADADGRRRLAALREQVELTTPEVPAPIQNLSQLGRLPALLAAFLATLGLVALANAVVVAVHRRRRDLALLRCIGFTPRQTAGSLRTMASVTALVGLVIGVPLGLLVGRVLWTAVASGLHVATDLAVPTRVLGAVVPAAFGVALLASVVPAARATRVRPALALRSE
jgi:predicted lysophospholipase L1 biosynthesis ABC-type transport system permease subunit